MTPPVLLSSFSRVLEASIAENKATLKRSHPEVWSDSPNPHDRKRTGNVPVGLKNVGNTCWFSAVIQVGPASMSDNKHGASTGVAMLQHQLFIEQKKVSTPYGTFERMI